MRIICHTDRDGVTAGALVYNWAQAMSNIMNDHSTGYIIVDEHIEIPRSYDSLLFYTEQNMLKFVAGEDILIYKSGYEFNDDDGRYDDVAEEELFIFVDLSISDNALRCISKILAQGGTILWLDHHKTTVGNADKIKETIKGYEDNVCILCDMNASGSLLAWTTFYTDFDSRITAADMRATGVFPYLVDDYDRWKFVFDTDEEKTTTWFGYGFDTNPEAFDPMSNFNRDLIFNTLWTILTQLNKSDPIAITGLNPSTHQMCEIARRTRMREIIDAIFNLVEDKNVTLESLIETGKHIDRYVTSTNAVTYKAYGKRYNIKIEELHIKSNLDPTLHIEPCLGPISTYIAEPGAEIKTLVSFDCAAINRSSNSLIFGDDYDKYTVCIPYVYQPSTNMYKYSLFSNKEKFNIDCSSVAKLFGGGGHAGAAGFTLPFNMFYMENQETTKSWITNGSGNDTTRYIITVTLLEDSTDK